MILTRMHCVFILLALYTCLSVVQSKFEDPGTCTAESHTEEASSNISCTSESESTDYDFSYDSDYDTGYQDNVLTSDQHLESDYVPSSNAPASETKREGNVNVLPIGFFGTSYRLPSNWHSLVPLENYSNRPIKYLEIGTFYGANALSFAETYGSHPDSLVYCVDPWEDYDDYPEYKGMQSSIFEAFVKNVAASPSRQKVVIFRGLSHTMVPTFPDESFDIIYIDGNHEPEYVMEDAVLSFRKLKKEGILIFDDYGWGGPDLTTKGIDGFISGYKKRLQVLGLVNTQMIVQKIS
jgi:predicted O-methyltransferase YrrM